MPVTGYPDRPRLWEWLQHQAPVEHALLWCRTIDSYRFREAVENDGCDPNECKIFEERLNYLFYGRPAFRVAEDDIATGHSAPVVLVFETDLVAAGARMFPFDSGAFVTKRYSGVMHKRMTLGNFELPVELESARKMVSAFFGTNHGYLRTAPRRPERNFKTQYEVEALVNLYSPVGRRAADDRRLAVELQVPARLDVSGVSLAALVYPDEFDDSDWFKPFAARLPPKVQLLSYPVYEDKIAKEYQTTLEGQVELFQKARGVK